MKKKLIIGLSIVLCLVLMAIPVSAFTTGTAAVSSATGEPGETVSLTVSLKDFEEAKSVSVSWPEEWVPVSGQWMLEDGDIVTLEDNYAIWAKNTLTDMNGAILTLDFTFPDDGTAVFEIPFTVKLLIDKEPVGTVTANGFIKLSCTHEAIHDIPATESSCHQQGNALYYYCADCDTYLKADKKTETTPDQELLPLERHNYAWVIDQEATDIAPGRKHEVCQNDGCSSTRSENTPIPILTHVHTPKFVPESDSTCISFGNIAHWICTGLKCEGKFYEDEACTSRIDSVLVEMKDHSWDNGVITKEHTATEAAIRTYDCKNCDAAKTESVSITATAVSKLSNTAKGISVSWNKVSDAAAYRIYVKTGSGSWTKVDSTTATNYTYTKAASGTKYFFTVQCLDADGMAISGYNTTGKGLVYYSQPAISKIANTKTGIQITWGKVAGADKYQIYMKTGSGSWTKLATTESTSYTYKEAKSGTKYYFTVQAMSASGATVSSYDTTGKGLVRYSQPAISKIANTKTGIQITWGKVAGADKYQIYMKTGSGSWTKLAATESTSYTYKDAKSGTKYYFSVQAMSASGATVSSYDTTGKGMTFYTQPAISKIANTSTGIKITWSKIAGADKYQIYMKTGTGSWTKLAATESTSYTYKEAKSGTKYYFTVQAMSSSGATVSSYSTTGKSITFYTQPAISKISNTSTGIKITWSKITGAGKYQIYMKTGSGSWTKLATTESTSYTYKEAKSGTKYYFTVQAMSSSGATASSYSTTGKSITFYTQPVIKTLTNTSTGIKVTWGKVTGAAKYQIYVKVGSGSWKKVDTTTSTSYVYKNVKSGTRYYFAIRAASSSEATLSSYDTTGKSIIYKKP